MERCDFTWVLFAFLSFQFAFYFIFVFSLYIASFSPPILYSGRGLSHSPQDICQFYRLTPFPPDLDRKTGAFIRSRHLVSVICRGKGFAPHTKWDGRDYRYSLFEPILFLIFVLYSSFILPSVSWLLLLPLSSLLLIWWIYLCATIVHRDHLI